MSYNELRKGRWSEPDREYLVTTVVLHRRPIFQIPVCARLFIEELNRVQRDGLCEWLAWVVMPDHCHGLLRLDSDGNLSSALRRLKGRSARRIQQHLGLTGRLWQPGFHDRALRREDDRIAIARYVVANPVRAGLVQRLDDYPHWDCVWLKKMSDRSPTK